MLKAQVRDIIVKSSLNCLLQISEGLAQVYQYPFAGSILEDSICADLISFEQSPSVLSTLAADQSPSALRILTFSICAGSFLSHPCVNLK